MQQEPQARRPNLPLTITGNTAVLLAVVAAVCAIAGVACGSDDRIARPGVGNEPTVSSDSGADVDTGQGSAPGSSHPEWTTPASEAHKAGAPRFAVGTIRVEFTDTARGRILPTIIHFPALGEPGFAGAPKAEGAFPLVVMAHGYLLPAAGYENLLNAITAAGYITASPAFPFTSADVGNGNRGDIVNQPADISFVINSVETLAAQPASPLPPVAHADRVGVIGHSDGGLTVAALAYNERYRDRRVGAAVVLTGGRALFPGNYLTGDGLPPVFAVHGTSDGNPYLASVSLARDAAARGVPAWLVTIENGSHIEPYMYDTALPQLGRSIADFFDAYLKAVPGAVEQLQPDASVPGVMRIQPG